jgi:hypothetical protein
MAVFEKQTTGTINAPELAKGEERQTKFYADLLATVGLDPKDAGGSINFTGPTDPIYDSPYYLAEGMSAILGAIGTAVAQIWKMRGGEEQDVTVDRLHAVQAMHRVNFLKQNGDPIVLTACFNPTGLTHRCLDGRFFEATTTLRHLELGMLDLLDCANTDDACREAYMKWNSFDLEEAVAHHNLCGAVHRGREEWRKHPQGKALMDLPVITIEKIGDSAPEPFAPAERPLSGVRILDHTHIIAGPIWSATRWPSKVLMCFTWRVNKISAFRPTGSIPGSESWHATLIWIFRATSTSSMILSWTVVTWLWKAMLRDIWTSAASPHGVLPSFVPA